jgi:predicted DNA-binding transcriptional regulator YafY
VGRIDQIARVLAVAKALMGSRRGVALKTLADRHGWNLRTLYRDVRALEQAGLPLVVEDGRYRLMEGAVVPSHVAVDGEELLALFVCRKLGAGYAGTKVGRALDRLWAKLNAAGEHEGSSFAGSSGLDIRAPRAIDYRAHHAAIRLIERAIERRQLLYARYGALSSGLETTRVIEPGRLRWDPGTEGLYLVGFCRLRNDIRVFAVHRFRAVTLLEETFAPRPELEVAKPLEHAFRLWRRSHVQRVELRFAADVAPEIRERRWHGSQTLSERSDGTIDLSMEVAEPLELVRWLAGFGAAVTVRQPRSLAVALATLHRDAVAATEQTRGSRRPAKCLTSGDNAWPQTSRTRRNPR